MGDCGGGLDGLSWRVTKFFTMNAIRVRAFLSAVLLLLFAGPGSVYGTSFYNRLSYACDVKLDHATIEEAVAWVKAAAIKQEGFERWPLNIVILGPVQDPTKRISLDLKDASLELVLNEVARTFGMRLRIETHAVVLSLIPAQEPIRTRIYRVSPDFLQMGSVAR